MFRITNNPHVCFFDVRLNIRLDKLVATVQEYDLDSSDFLQNKGASVERSVSETPH